jgi:hypothetical protein
MDDVVFSLGSFAIFLAVMAIVGFVRTYRAPPPPRDLDKDWLGN